MYTIVLMAAMTSGTAAPDWHRHGHGCHGVVAGCHGCVGGCGGCYGGGPYAGFNSGAGPAYGGTCLGTYGGYSVSGPNPIYGCWGCWGGNTNLTVYSGAGCYGYGSGVGGGGMPGFGISFQCHGCYGCYGGWSCYGSPTNIGQIEPIGAPGGVVSPNTPPVVPSQPLPKIEESPLPQKEARVRSKVIIEVPQNAKLYVDDNLINVGAGAQTFHTPPLSPNQTYFYDVRVVVTHDGKTTTDSQRLVIRPGHTVTAAFREPGRPDVVTVRNVSSD